MFKEIKGSLIAAIISFILTIILTFLMNFILGNQGEIVYSSILKDGQYINTIMVKNMQNHEYLNNINFVMDSEIDILNNIVFINGKENKIDNNTIILNDVNPSESLIITFKTTEIINNKNLFLVKNNQRIEIENFNEKENNNIYFILLVGFYCLINFILSIKNDLKAKKRNDETNKKLDEAQKQSEICEEKIDKLIKEEKVNKSVYLKEMNDMEKEIEFYQQIILKCANKEISKVELEKIISKELKTFTRKKMKYLSYSDIYKIVNELSDK